MKYNIISTGSKGNATIINDIILIDCGVAYGKIEPHISGLKLVLLTHIHGDHFHPMTIKRIAKMRPTLRFGCCKWLVKPLMELGVQKWRIDVYVPNTVNAYNSKLKVEAVELYHDVPNCGYKILCDGEKIFYATDTNSLYGITAPDYDLYLIEANYDDEEIHKRIRAKEAEGIFPYEYRVMKTHLSKTKCDEFLTQNVGENSKFEYMHGHIEK